MSRKIFLFGSAPDIETLKALVKPNYFLVAKTQEEYAGNIPIEVHFVCCAVDFENSMSMQYAANVFTRMCGGGAVRVIYSSSAKKINQDQRLFCQEIGARFVAQGPKRATEFRDYTRRVSVEAQRLGSLCHFEEQIMEAIFRHDRNRLADLSQQLSKLPDRGEEILRLMALASQGARDFRKAEIYLRNILRMNSQNLWAANELGRHYLETGRVAQGVEVLQRLSQFHELNGERLLELGNAYVKAGDGNNALEIFEKGRVLTQDQDDRFIEGVTKAYLASGETQKALDFVKDKGFSPEVIAFLNMRAIMTIRSGTDDRFDKGMNYYHQALSGARNDLTKAKLFFNMGLAQVRHERTNEAQTSFTKSLKLGKDEFTRAKGPLKVIEKIRKSEKSDGSTDGSEDDKATIHSMVFEKIAL